jgi:DNA-directed RNA polymerase specialized sigma24 family protein
MWAAESGGVGTSRFVASGDDPATAAARAQMLERIDRARRSLVPPRDEAVGLHLQGFTTREIGGLLGWTEPKARNLVYRGLAELKTAMGNEGVELEADEE